MSDLLDVSGRINTLRVQRGVAEVQPRFYRLEGEATEFAPAGTVTVVVGTSATVQELEDALRGGDVGAINDVARRANSSIQRYRRGYSAVEAAVASAPSFVDVAFGDQVLARAVTADDNTFARVVHPYLGGGFDESKLTVAEFFEADAGRQDLVVLVVAHEPVLDEITRSVLDRAQAEGDHLRIGVDPDAVACTVTATPVIVAVTVAIVATAATSCAPTWNDNEWWSNPDPVIADLAPRLAIDKLLAMRAADFSRSTK